MAARTAFTSVSDKPDAVRCSGRFSTSSYSRKRAGVMSGTKCLTATKSSSLFDAPCRLRKADITTELSSTTRLTAPKWHIP